MHFVKKKVSERIDIMNKQDKIYIAGHRGLVGSAIIRNLQANGYSNLITRTSSELNLTNQQAVNEFFEKLGIEVQSDTCLDDLGNHDWWVVKPIDYDDIVAADTKTMNKLIPKDENDIELFVDKEK